MIHLDTVYPKLLKGSWVILANEETVELYKIEDVNDSFGRLLILNFSSKVSQIRLDKEGANNFDKRKTVVFAQSEALVQAEKPITDPVFGAHILLDGHYPDLVSGQRLAVGGELLRFVRVEAPGLKFEPDEGAENIAVYPGKVFGFGAIEEIVGTSEFRWRVNDHQGNSGTIQAPSIKLAPFALKEDSPIPRLPTSIDQPMIFREVVEIAEVIHQDGNTEIFLETPLQRVYLRDTVNINANVTRSTHGESKTEILGDGDASKKFQKFYLKQNPLTYNSSATPSGIDSTLEIRVNDILWKEAPTFYGRGPQERIFITRTEDSGSVYVQFGDGFTGARLPSGTANVRASYRVGIGSPGLLKTGQLSQLLTPRVGLKSVNNPMPAIGAEDPESLKDIRHNAPLTVLTLDRVVSIQDFEDFANAFAGIGKARADLLWKGEERMVHLTIAAADKGPVSETLAQNLVTAIKGVSHTTCPVRVSSFEPVYFNLTAGIRIRPDYLPEKVIARIKEDLLLAFGFDSRSFGQGITPAEVITGIQAVEGVVSVDLDNLGGANPFAQAFFGIQARNAEWIGDAPAPAQLLMIDPDDIQINFLNT